MDLEDRKPQLLFDYEGFTVGEQTKVEANVSSVKQRKLYNCIFMSKQSDKYIRLPSHLACKTCPNAKVDCYVHLSPEYPEGDLRDRCATCLSKCCAFVKMDATTRAEIRTWLDAELRRRRALAAANPAFGRDTIDQIINVDGGTAPRAGRKRGRPVYVDIADEDEEDGEDGIEDVGQDGMRTRSRYDAGPSRTATTSRALNTGSAESSEFVQQAIRLVQESKTTGPQLAKMRTEVKAANIARQEAEKKAKGIEGMEKKLREREEALIAALEKEKDALQQAQVAEEEKEEAENTVRRLRRERDHALGANARSGTEKAGLEARVKQAELEARLGKVTVLRLEDELVREQEAHETKSKELAKYRASIAALQGL